jgi:hypothetical protein
MSDLRHDPNFPRNADRDSSGSMWAMLAIAVVVVFGLVLSYSRTGNDVTASNPPASTTGSGSVSEPALPSPRNTRP